MQQEIVDRIAQRSIRRLVHFTPSRNLYPIVRDEMLRPVDDLKGDEFLSFASTDANRYDGQLDKISCSVEYPNVYYLRTALSRTDNYPDWACFLLDPVVMARDGALFSSSNAGSADASRALGVKGFDAMYKSDISNSRRTVRRSINHLPASPTDIQAEVQVPGGVLFDDILGVVVPTEADAVQEFGRLDFLGADAAKVRWWIAPAFFDVGGVLRAVRDGREISMRSWEG